MAVRWLGRGPGHLSRMTHGIIEIGEEEMTTLLERFVQEGVPMNFSASFAGSGDTATGVLCEAGPIVKAGKIPFITEILGDFSAQAQLRVNIGGPAGTSGSQGFNSRELYFNTPEKGGGQSFRVNWLMKPYFFQLTTARLILVNKLGNTYSSPCGSVVVNGYQITDDLNYNAAKVIMCVGDSTWDGAGITSTYNMLPYRIRDYFNGANPSSINSNTRLVLKTVSGASSSNHEEYRKLGFHDIEQCDLLIYCLGPNDVGGSPISTETSIANVTAMWNWFKIRYPRGKMLILGPGQVQNVTKEAALQLIRDGQDAFVDGVNDPRLTFCSLAGAFTATDDAMYASSDADGDGVHTVDAAQGLQFTVCVKPFLDANLTAI